MTASIDNEGTPSETALETFREEEFEDSPSDQNSWRQEETGQIDPYR